MRTIPDKFPSLTQIAKGTAKLLIIQNGEAWYRLDWYEDDVPFVAHSLEFPIPVAEMNEGQFELEMKGMGIMRWARKHVAMLKMPDEAQG